MRIKKIELAGFKSFREKTTVSFNENIIGVVGPNGCGKSNIVDSIKWCIGTLSSKTIRADELLDVIFKGTDIFPSAGFASVTITFDNASKILPVPYEEVSITRKVYKSGESSFYINNSQCRLRDIRDLLQNTGLDEGGYAVIEQGKVDKLVNASPYERRALFDEVSGIARYKAKRKESLSKLDKLEIDIKNLDEVLNEVVRSVHSLKIQAGRAKKYKDVQDQYNAKKKLYYIKEFNALNEAIKNVSGSKDTFYTTIKELEKNHLEFKTKLATVNEEKDQIQNKILQLNASLNQQTITIDSLQREIKEMESGYQQLNESKSKLETYLQELEEGTKASYEESANLTRKKADLASKTVELGQARIRLDQESAIISGDLAKLQAEVEVQSQQQKQLSEEAGKLTESLNHVEVNKKLLEQEYSQKSELLNSISQKISKNNDSKHQISGEFEELEIKLQTCEAELDSVAKQYEVSKNELENIITQLNETELHIKSLNLKREGLSLIRQSESASKGKQTIRDIVKAKPSYEKVVNTFLSEFGGSYVIGNIDQTFEFIKNSRHIESKFLLPSTKSQNYNSHKHLNEVVDIAADDPFVKEVVDAYLSVFVIADGLADAQEIVKENKGYNVITAKGELITSNVFQSALSDEDELQRYMSQLESDKVGLEQSKVSAESGLLKLEEMKKALGEALEKIRSDRSVIEARLSDLGVAVDDLNKQKTEIQTAADSIKAQLESITAEFTACLAAADEGKIRLEELTADLERKRASVSDLEKRLDSAKNDFVKTENELSISVKEQEHVESELGRIGEILREKDLNHQRFSKELEACVEKIDQNEEIRVSKMLQIETFNKDIEKVKVELDTFTKYMHTIEKEIGELTASISECEQKQVDLNKSFHDNELEYKVVETKLEEHRRRVREDIGEEIDALLSTPVDPKLVDEQASIETLKVDVEELGGKLRHFGAVNMIAIEKLEEAEQRQTFLEQQKKDLLESREKLVSFIEELNGECNKMFKSALKLVEEYFNELFRKVFGGGNAGIELVKEDGVNDELETGLDIVAKLPGKKAAKLQLMSGGEKALTSMALTLAMFRVKQCGVCILDEVDAPMDENNVLRFCNLIKELSSSVQYIVITHNKRTMQICEKLYGITMQPKGVSKVIEVDLKNKKFENIPELTGVT